MRGFLLIVVLIIAKKCFAEHLNTDLILDLRNDFGKRYSLVFLDCNNEDELRKMSLDITKKTDKPIMVQFMNNKMNNVKQNIMFIADVGCSNIKQSFITDEAKKIFRPPFKWIFLNKQQLNQSDSVLFESGNVHLDEDVVMVTKRKDIYQISFVYKISNKSNWKIERFGEWSANFGLIKNKEWVDVTSLRRKNLGLNAINVCFVLTDSDSIHHLTDGKNDHIDTITKVNYPTINHLLDYLNASKNYIFTDTWGYKNNNSWNGMTGYMVRGEVDIGGSPMFFTTQRMSVVEYISSPTPTRSMFVFRQPKLSYENNLFLLSFHKYLWYGSVSLLAILFIALFFITFWEWKKTRLENSMSLDSTVLRPNVSDIAILIFAATCQQGSHTELKGSLGRIVLLLLFISLTFLYTSYSANIVALLQSSSSQIRSLDDLLHSRLSFGVHDTVFNRYYFSIETEPIRKAIYETKITLSGGKTRFMTMDEGIKKMQMGLFAFHMETGVGYKFVSKYFEEGEKCGLEEIQYLQVIDPWLAVQKDTPYMELFKIGTKRLQEHGLQQRENRLLYEKRPKCLSRQDNFVSVSMVDCYPALLILSYGSLLALTLLIFEILYEKKKQSRKTFMQKK
ncbi:unnamed protein product [Pieris macdunnoughi]|uniref:Uncharacterized protein n=1 Tax=Pieris macdunnoughi TaxID=345717 RepID=A0A821R3K6_9NEOP|nr:unnamed protein product [Pieris macdunnoughi]